MINIYYLEYCPYSQKALETLQKYNINHSKIESSNNKIERQQYYPTFPQIYWHNNLIGGNDNLTKIIQTLRSNIIPDNHNKWTRRTWISCLLNITEKL
jgi:glutaredoxin-related protein